MAVLPEKMNPLTGDVRGNFRTIEEYIGYMAERLEFSQSNLGKTISAAGVSSIQLYLIVVAMESEVSSLKGQIGQISGDVTQGKADIVDIKARLDAIDAKLPEIDAALKRLDERVTALENPPAPPAPEPAP